MKVAVTGMNNIDNPGPGVPVVRGIKDSGQFNGEIVGLIYDALEPGMYLSNVSDNNYIIPYPSGGLDTYYERLAHIHQQEKLDVIIPTLDAELFAYSKLEQSLKALGIKMFLPNTQQLAYRAKDKLSQFCDNNDIRTPKSILATSGQDLLKIASELNYPVAVKGIFYDAYIAHNVDEAFAYFNKIASKWGMPIILQEFIRGEEYNVAALGDGKGETVGAVAMKKMYITDKGKGWAGVTIKDPKLIEITNHIIASLEWKSGAELEFVKDSVSGEYYLIEINPRFPAWVYLAVGAGQNLPFASLQLAMGEKVNKMDNYEVGKIFIRYSWDLITDIKQFEEITVKGALSHDEKKI